MQNLRTLRQRIRSVQNTQKVTKAMQMVAGAKLRRMQSELMSFRPYAQRLEEMAGRFLSAYPALEHPLLGGGVIASPEGMKHSDDGAHPPVGLILVTSDTGLCGTYNERMLALGQGFLRENPSAVVVTLGRKGDRACARRGIPRAKEIVNWGGRYHPDQVKELADWLEGLYLEKKVSGWQVAYTQFLSALKWKPVVERLLPLERPALSTDLPEKLIVEPDPPAFAERILSRHVRVRLGRMLLEAFTAEHSARMMAMKNATENAAEMIKTLTLVRNKARQAAITKELIEIVSGAQALQ